MRDLHVISTGLQSNREFRSTIFGYSDKAGPVHLPLWIKGTRFTQVWVLQGTSSNSDCRSWKQLDVPCFLRVWEVVQRWAFWQGVGSARGGTLCRGGLYSRGTLLALFQCSSRRRRAPSTMRHILYSPSLSHEYHLCHAMAFGSLGGGGLVLRCLVCFPTWAHCTRIKRGPTSPDPQLCPKVKNSDHKQRKWSETHRAKLQKQCLSPQYKIYIIRKTGYFCTFQLEKKNVFESSGDNDM